ncbi:MAG: PspC domain-containing protein [Actinomycetota bacterium]|nr:PspC domain-containing protein [Rubrobacter sp.]MDQ3508099.1 PspC domain-containing protein [Actinomycetota bacterium]
MGIERSTRDRYLMGVCGGIAYSLGWNANLVRAITVLAGIVIPGVSVFLVGVAYIVLGFVLPESRDF